MYISLYAYYTFVILKIDQGGLTLPTADNYLNVSEHGKVLNAYWDYMTKVRKIIVFADVYRAIIFPRERIEYRYSYTFSDRRALRRRRESHEDTDEGYNRLRDEAR